MRQGHHTWTDDEIAAFERRWPIGTRERLAFALLLWTGQRSADVIALHWDHLKDGIWTLHQRKTGALAIIPIHPSLAAILRGSCPAGSSPDGPWVPGPPGGPSSGPEGRPVLTTWRGTVRRGSPWTASGFRQWMARAIDQAGLPSRCVPHGLRKACCRRLAEAGCSSFEIAAVSGHRTLAMVEHYCRAASQKRLAQSALAKLGSGEGGHH